MRKQIYFTGLFFASLSLFHLSCRKHLIQEEEQKEISAIANKAGKAKKQKIHVSDIDELYSSVNDPANEGSEVTLAPGTYLLDATYPKGGRLELQGDMSLVGQPGHAELVIIDQTSLPSSSFTVASSRTGGIRMGRGNNSLEWLTVKGNVNALSAIDTDLLSTETQVRLAHLIVSGSQVGIDIRNRLAEHSGRRIEAEIEHNEVLWNTASFGTGIAIQNANGVTGAVINATLRDNYIHHNRMGFRAFNNAATVTVNSSRITVTSKSDRIENNGMAMYVAGGLSQVAAAFANDNFTRIDFHGASIRNNNPSPMPDEIKPLEATIPFGGIFASGGNSTGNTNKVFNNILQLDFQACHISGNGTDINAFGAWSRPPVLIPGTNNSAEIQLHGVSKKAIVVAIPCVPFEPAGTNTVSIIR